jgi:hypothetical protein
MAACRERLVNKTRSFQYQEREYSLRAEVVPCGSDTCIVITGGDQPHIGAAALGVVTGSAAHPGKSAVTSSVLSVPGHKEGQLALEAAERLSKVLESTVVVTVGIHIDGITPELIELVREEFNLLVADLSQVLQQG